MGAVRAAAEVGGTLGKSGRNVEGIDIKTLNLSVGLGVLQEAKDEVGALDGPATLGVTPLLALSLAADGTVVLGEGDDLLLGLDVLEEGNGTVHVHATDGLDGLMRVLLFVGEKMGEWMREEMAGGGLFSFCHRNEPSSGFNRILASEATQR